MDYIQEYCALLQHRIKELEVQVAVLRSMLPNPPPTTPTQPPHPQPKHLAEVRNLSLAKDLSLKKE